MRSVDSWLDRFCRKHPKLGIPHLMLIVLVGNIVVFMIDMVSNHTFSSLLYFIPEYILRGQVWRLVTFVFAPATESPLTLVLSLYFYWWAGSTLEREWGSAKFTLYYLMGLFFNVLLGFLFYFIYGGGGIVTMDCVHLSFFFAFATLFPDMRILLFFFIPVKVKWMAWLDAAYLVFTMLSSFISLDILGGLLPIVAVLNYVLFFWSDIADFFKRRVQRAKYRNSKQTINFKQATRQAQERKGYIHKCAVCGKTDADFPNEEFRYCSQCNGYYCYCSEHIRNHVHIQ